MFGTWSSTAMVRTCLQAVTCMQLPTPLNPLPYKDRPTMAMLTATEQRTKALDDVQ